MPSKGSRKLVVGDLVFRWAVSPWARRSEWRAAGRDQVDARWLAVAERFRLGDVADVAFSITVALAQAPRSRLRATLHSRVVDGFLGAEQSTQVTPGMVRNLIDVAMEDGWDPAGKRSVEMELYDRLNEPTEPVLLVLPDTDLMPDIEGYTSRARVRRIR